MEQIMATNLNLHHFIPRKKLPPSLKLHHHKQLNQSTNTICHQINSQLTLDQTNQIHAHLLKSQFQITHQIPFKLPSTPVACYTFIITSYNNNNHPIFALTLYAHMRANGIEVDSFTIPSVLKSCAQIRWALFGQEIHGFALKIGLGSDIFVGNALMQMYTECGFVGFARLMFDKMTDRDVVSWSTMIRAYIKNRMFDEALELIKEMHHNMVKPSEITMISMVNLFADMGKIELSKAMHAYVIKNREFTHSSYNLTTSLIHMYVKSGNSALARCIFDNFTEKGIVSYTSMVAGYISCNALEDGVNLFAEMLRRGVWPNEVTLLSLITECGVVKALDFGKQLHCYALKNVFVMTMALGTSLVDMYGKCGEIESARAVFDRMERRDVMTWTSLVSAYARGQCINEAIDLLFSMRYSGINPNQVTMVSLVSLCAETGALNMGKWLHAYIENYHIQFDGVLRTALIDMYAKCGDIASASELFIETRSRDICMWNTMITGLGMHGLGEKALEVFTEMEDTRIKPNNITFIGLLHACSHAGMVTEGKQIFENMVNKYYLVPKIEHYGCMIDLLGRAGLLHEAYEMIQNMPMKPNTIIWSALVAACKVHKNHSLGAMAARELLQLDPGNCGYNVLVANVYATANRWTDVAAIRAAIENEGMKKEPGFSCIEANGSIHKFTSGDQSHPQFEQINNKLEEATKKLGEVGYRPETSVVLQNIGEEEKRRSLKYHSEKIAMAFALISTKPGTPIRIVKNLRVCEDCHAATKLLSKIFRRQIIVRDRNRFHHFSNGKCSCGDYW